MTDLGHNNPPALERHRLRVDALIATADRWLRERPEITSDETAGRCSDFLEQLTVAEKAVERDRKAEKAPHLDAAKAVDAAYAPLRDALAQAKRLLRGRLTPWLERRERERREAARRAESEALDKLRAAEAAKRKAAEEARVEDALAAEKAEKDAAEAIRRAEAAEKARVGVKGDFGSRSRGLRTTYRAVIEDFDAALAHYRDHPRLREAVQQLADADARNPATRARPIPGLRIVEQRDAA